MKDKIYIFNSNFIEEKVKKIFDMPVEISFIARFDLLSGLREQEIIYKEKEICSNGYGWESASLLKLTITIIAIGWTRGNKKILVTIFLLFTRNLRTTDIK